MYPSYFGNFFKMQKMVLHLLEYLQKGFLCTSTRLWQYQNDREKCQIVSGWSWTQLEVRQNARLQRSPQQSIFYVHSQCTAYHHQTPSIPVHLSRWSHCACESFIRSEYLASDSIPAQGPSEKRIHLQSRYGWLLLCQCVWSSNKYSALPSAIL